jgi:hypothetical protein
LHQGRVPLRHLVHLGQRLVDLIDPDRLLLAGRGDLGHEIGDLLDRDQYLGQRAAGLVRQPDALLHLARALGDQILDVLGGLRRPLREASHLGGRHTPPRRRR